MTATRLGMVLLVLASIACFVACGGGGNPTSQLVHPPIPQDEVKDLEAEKSLVDPENKIEEVERIWFDSTGKYSVRAKYVESKDGKVTLEKLDGSTVELDVAKLSDSDQKWLREKPERDKQLADQEREREAEIRRKLEPTPPRPVSRPVVDRLTIDKFNQVSTGMSKSEVLSILGDDTTVISENEFGQGTDFHVHTQMLQWQSGFKTVHIMFQNGKVVQKSQFGL